MGDSLNSPIGHGGLLDDELAAARLCAGDVLDVSVNVNPFGPCPAVRDAVARAPIHRYPDPGAARARRAVAEWLNVSPSRVTLGNGATDLLWTLARGFLRRGDVVAIVEPAFSEMRAAAARVGAALVELRTNAEDDFALDVPRLHDLLERLCPRLLYLATPSNPAGVCTSLHAIVDLAARHPATLFVVDTSFLSLSTQHADLGGRLPEGIVWVRSLTKDHALAGLRVGCVVAPAAIVSLLDAERPPWSVNGLAQAAAVAATTVSAAQFIEESRRRLLAAREHLDLALRGAGVHVHPSETVYTLARLPLAFTASDLRRRLLYRHGILVRDCTSFGLPQHVRLAARPAHEVDRVTFALRQELRS